VDDASKFGEYGIVRGFLRRVCAWLAYWLGPPEHIVYIEGADAGGSSESRPESNTAVAYDRSADTSEVVSEHSNPTTAMTG
jgi:hypothetical protein